MAVRKVLRGNAEIFVVKNTLATRAMKQAGIKNAEELMGHLTGQNALLFSNLDPFKLYLMLEKNRVSLAARAGDIAPNDIIVPLETPVNRLAPSSASSGRQVSRRR